MCLSSIDWGYLWQGPQEIMSRFAREGSRVLFVENTGIRAPRPQADDWSRISARLRAWLRSPGGQPRDESRNLVVLSPVLLPFPWSRLARPLNRLVFADRLPARAHALGIRRPAVWTFLPTPVALDALRAFGRDRALAIYYCVADFEHLADDPHAERRFEDELLSEVDLVFAGGRVLERRLARRHPRVVLAPFSVSDYFFEPPRGVPTDLAHIARPRVGYVGGLHRHVDTALLLEVLRAMPDVQFVFVGPQISGPWPIEGLPNAHFLGRRSHRDVPAYVDGLDVCLVPYRLSPFTETVWPTKLHEYLARGRPVVSTPLPEVSLLGYPPELVRVAASPHEFAGAIRDALADTARPIAERQHRAQEQSWATGVARMRVEIERTITSAASAADG